MSMRCVGHSWEKSLSPSPFTSGHSQVSSMYTFLKQWLRCSLIHNPKSGLHDWLVAKITLIKTRLRHFWYFRTRRCSHHKGKMVVNEEDVVNIMGGMEHAGGIKLNDHKRKLKNRWVNKEERFISNLRYFLWRRHFYIMVEKQSECYLYFR